MGNQIFSNAIETIASLIEGQRIAGSGTYQVLWIKDRFEVRKTKKVDSESFLIAILMARDINEGPTDKKWDIITARVRTLTKTGVIK